MRVEVVCEQEYGRGELGTNWCNSIKPELFKSTPWWSTYAVQGWQRGGGGGQAKNEYQCAIHTHVCMAHWVGNF